MNQSRPKTNKPHARERTLLLAACLLGGALLAPVRAEAQATADSPSANDQAPEPKRGDAQRALQLNELGAEHFEAGRYRQAIESFVEAHAMQPDSNLLFNIAACYERLLEPAAAIEKYELFVQAEDGAPEGKPAARAAIARLQEEIQRDNSPPRKPLAPTAAVAAPSPTPNEPGQPDGPADGSSTPQWVTWAAVGTGGALLAAGGLSYALGVGDHRQVSNSRGYNRPQTVSSLTRQQADDWVASGNVKKAFGVGALVSGVAVLSGYAGWYLWGATEQSATVTVGGLQAAAFVSVSGAF